MAAKHNDGMIACDDGGSPIFAMRTFSQMRSQLTNMTLIIEFSSKECSEICFHSNVLYNKKFDIQPELLRGFTYTYFC